MEKWRGKKRPAALDGAEFSLCLFCPINVFTCSNDYLWSQHRETQRSCCVPIQEEKWCSYGYFAAHDCVPKGQDHIKRLITSINNSLFLKITNETENHFVLLRFVFKQQMWFFFSVGLVLGEWTRGLVEAWNATPELYAQSKSISTFITKLPSTDTVAFAWRKKLPGPQEKRLKGSEWYFAASVSVCSWLSVIF